MSRTQKLNGLVAASLRLKTLNDNPYLKCLIISEIFVNMIYMCNFESKWIHRPRIINIT